MQQRIEAAQALLAYVKEMGVAAVICGGYARDTYCKKPIRDVDLYVAEEDFWSTANALFGVEQSRMVQNVEVDAASIEYLHQSIVRQFEDTLHADLDFGLEKRLVNLIGVNSACAVTADDITSRFNLGICKAAINEFGMWTSADFGRDHADMQITLLRTDWGYEATMKQFLKLQAKYPWPMRVRKQEELF